MVPSAVIDVASAGTVRICFVDWKVPVLAKGTYKLAAVEYVDESSITAVRNLSV